MVVVASSAGLAGEITTPATKGHDAVTRSPGKPTPAAGCTTEASRFILSAGKRSGAELREDESACPRATRRLGACRVGHPLGRGARARLRLADLPGPGRPAADVAGRWVARGGLRAGRL